MAINLYTPVEMQRELANRAKQRRLEQNLTQIGLAQRSGVSLGSLKRFERNGQISLEAFLKLSLVLGNLQDFLHIMATQDQNMSLDEIIKRSNRRQRGRQV